LNRSFLTHSWWGSAKERGAFFGRSGGKLESDMKKKTTRKDFVVTVSGDRHISEVARDLKASGFQVGQVLDAIGVVTGSAPATHAAKLRRVPGVKDVSADQPVDIGPPGAGVS
jgi:hypothetical protein